MTKQKEYDLTIDWLAFSYLDHSFSIDVLKADQKAICNCIDGGFAKILESHPFDDSYKDRQHSKTDPTKLKLQRFNYVRPSSMAEFNALSEALNFVERDKGFMNFKQSADIRLSQKDGCGVTIGIVAWGGSGQRGRVYFSFNGLGSNLLIGEKIYDYIVAKPDYRITRLDLAFDLFQGQYNVFHAYNWVKNGEFNPKRGPAPSYCPVGDFLDDDWKDGRTLYVGSRQNDRFLRVYEKGRQLGDPSSEWVRFEVEFKNTNQFVIDPLALKNIKSYFLGAYRCFQTFFAKYFLNVDSARMSAVKRKAEAALKRSLYFAKQQYGKLLAAISTLGLTDSQIIELLSREGRPKKLRDFTFEKLKEVLNEHRTRGDFLPI